MRRSAGARFLTGVLALLAAGAAGCTSLRGSAPSDAGARDAGRTDAGGRDAGSPVDGGRDDAGPLPLDAGPVDAGAGPLGPCPDDPRLVACWPLDEDGSDRGRAGLDLFAVGVPRFDDPVGGVDLDGESRLQVADDPALDELYLTIEAWIRLDSAPAAGPAVVVDIDNRMVLAFELGAGLICGTTAMAEVRGAGLSFETWAHVVCSLRDDELALYVNGARAVAVGASRGLPITSGALAVGGGAPDGTAEWVGAIDDVRIYRAPLTDTEIIAHFKAGRLR